MDQIDLSLEIAVERADQLTYKDEMHACLRESQEEIPDVDIVLRGRHCHSQICSHVNYPECLEEDDTLEYIILFVIIGLICYGGYKYFNK